MHIHRSKRRALAGACAGLALGACGPSSPPERQSPELVLVEALPEGSGFPLRSARTSATRGAWLLEVGGGAASELELHDDDGVVGSVPASAVDLFDVAPDRAAVVCNDEELRVLDGSTSTVTPFSEISPRGGTGSGYSCHGLAMRSRHDVWLMLAIVGAIVPQRVCRSLPSGWECAELSRSAYPRTLVLTADHAWWISDGNLVSIETSRALEPLAIDEVATDVGGWGARLQGSTDSETVLVTREIGSDASDAPPELISIEGARAPQQTSLADGEGYEAMWLAPGDRVLALDVTTSARCGGGGGPYGYVGGVAPTCTTEWTQMVLFELGLGAPRELGHANVEVAGGGTSAVAVERPEGTHLSVAGSGWYRAS